MEVILCKTEGLWKPVLMPQKRSTVVVIFELGVRHACGKVVVLPGVSEGASPEVDSLREALEAHPEPHTLNVAEGNLTGFHRFF